MNNNFRYIVTLPSANEILLVQIGKKLGSHSLENIELEYETIDNIDLADDVRKLYSKSKSLSYQHVTLMKKVVWAAASICTLINENRNIPQKYSVNHGISPIGD